MSSVKKVLYIGSGNSALLAKDKDLSDYIVVCANNAWRIFEDGGHFNYWVHSGDFPTENKPKVKNFDFEISYKEYSESAKNIVKKLNVKTTSPDHYVGYTIFFLGLHWIFDTLNPDEVYLLGFDHDYNPEKTTKWLQNDKPNPQNHFLKRKDQSIKDWSEEFFKEYKPDFFYGHGTPDPIRLGEHHLKDKFKQVIKNSELLNIKLLNASPIESEINKIEKTNKL